MAIIQSYRFQYNHDPTTVVPYVGRHWSAALYEKDGNIARIILNRPEKRNALNDDLFEDLMAALHAARDDQDVRVVILKGAGAGFCAGHDLSSPKRPDGCPEETPPIPPDIKPTMRDFYNIERRRCTKYWDLFNYPKPTIAQVHGFCIGGGEIIACQCDLFIAAEDALIGMTGHGRHSPDGAWRWPGTYPSGSGRRHANSIEPAITGASAAEWGIINKAVPLAELDAEVERWARAIAETPPEAALLFKEFLHGSAQIGGVGGAWRVHYNTHNALQFARFPKGETNFYKTRRDSGLREYFREKVRNATPRV